MKANVWAAVQIVFFGREKQGLPGVHAYSSNRTPVWSFALLFCLVYNMPEGVALSLSLSLLTQAILFSTWMLMLPLVVMCPL